MQAAAEAAHMPAGMRVLGDGERQEMLDALSRSNQQIQAQLLGMPLVLETPSQVPRDLAAAHL
jgi:Calmodulin-binding